jgi:hypothetical protein
MLFNDIQNLIEKLNGSIKILAKYGNDYAETEKNYKIALRQEALKLRDEKMAVTLINQIVYGVPEVAEKRFKRDVAEAMYKTALENINVLKLQIKILAKQLDYEWGNAGNE